ncbi:hypothetical protein A9D12_03300 [Erythrobacter neustonensis]|uniref:Uncharacterized protein n=1 Tax=Erythrobacter neustonensis TaxID=1112 RepID=A0A192D2Z0_9SPHN|nr:hypothetical protein A9D12_03300 [Erythrobacter neustonensis]
MIRALLCFIDTELVRPKTNKTSSVLIDFSFDCRGCPIKKGALNRKDLRLPALRYVINDDMKAWVGGRCLGQIISPWRWSCKRERRLQQNDRLPHPLDRRLRPRIAQVDDLESSTLIARVLVEPLDTAEDI